MRGRANGNDEQRRIETDGDRRHDARGPSQLAPNLIGESIGDRLRWR